MEPLQKATGSGEILNNGKRQVYSLNESLLHAFGVFLQRRHIVLSF
jgi:hypothetical protein